MERKTRLEKQNNFAIRECIAQTEERYELAPLFAHEGFIAFKTTDFIRSELLMQAHMNSDAPIQYSFECDQEYRGNFFDFN